MRSAEWAGLGWAVQGKRATVRWFMKPERVRADNPVTRSPTRSNAAGPARFGARTATPPAQGASANAFIERLVAHFVGLGRGPGGAERLVESSDAVLTTLRKAADSAQWQPVLDLVRVAEPAFKHGARWGAWASTLDLGLQAARLLGERTAEAWVLHEQGVRFMALGDHDQAEKLLSQALAIRTELCADDEAERTRFQLAQVTLLKTAAG